MIFNVLHDDNEALRGVRARFEVFSAEDFEGRTFEASAVADADGQFTVEVGRSFAGPHLTATATAPDGGTSEYSFPTVGPAADSSMQVGNEAPRRVIEAQPASGKLAIKSKPTFRM